MKKNWTDQPSECLAANTIFRVYIESIRAITEVRVEDSGYVRESIW
jgi:hypothetical protein